MVINAIVFVKSISSKYTFALDPTFTVISCLQCVIRINNIKTLILSNSSLAESDNAAKIAQSLLIFERFHTLNFH